MTEPLFYSMREVAKMLGVGYSTITRMVNDGRIPSASIGDRRIIPKSYVDGLVAEALASERRERKLAEEARVEAALS